jgi:hypothetical protein
VAQILVRATVTTDGYCAGWVGYVDDTDPVVQELVAGGYLTTNVTVLPPPVELCCLPPGGTTNQILAKVSNLDRDANWQNAPPSLPSGPASGVLSGTYPNPIFAEDMATQAELNAAIAGATTAPIFANVKDFGAIGNGVANDTTAVQAALAAGANTVFFPAGTYSVTTLNLATTGTKLLGAGRTASTILFAGTSDHVTLAAGINKITIESLTLQNTSSGGHLFAPAGSVNTMNVLDVACIQNNPARSIWTMGNFGYLDNLWLGCILTHNGAASVPAFNYVTTSLAANQNTWERCQCNHVASATAPFFHVESAGAATYNYGNTFRDLTFEICNAGLIRLLSANGCLIENCASYDLTTTTANLITIGAGGGALASRDNTIRRFKRIGGTIGGGFFDIALGASGKAVTTTIQDSNQSNGAGITADLQSNQRAVIIGSDNIVLTNKHQSTIQIDRGRFVGETVQVFTKAGAPVDADFNVTPADGSIAINTTTPAIYTRVGGTWVVPAATGTSGSAGGVLTGSYPNPSFAASPAFTGDPTAPTPAAGDNDTSIATTAFVTSAITASSGFVYGTAAPATGAHIVHELVWNSVPEAGGNMGWICITAGTPGTWKPWGVIGV